MLPLPITPMLDMQRTLPDSSVGPMPSARGSGDDAEQRSDGQLEARVEPWPELLLAPCVHADFAAPSALAVTDQQRPAPLVEIGFSQGERFLDP